MSLRHVLAGIDHLSTVSIRTRPKLIVSVTAPFYEPRLEEVIREVTGSGLLTAGGELISVLGQADIALICVGTPSAPDGDFSLA